jgi:hypothetical protein
MSIETQIQQPPRESVRPDELAAYDRVIGRQNAYGYNKSTNGYVTRPKGTEAGPFFGTLLHSPLIADYISELGVVYRTRGEVPGSYQHKDREWVDIVLGQYLGFNMWGHIADGIAVGVRPEAALAILEGREEDLLDEERRLAEYIRAFADGNLTDEQRAYVKDHFGERGSIEFTAFIGHLIMILRLLQSFVGRNSGTDAEMAANVRKIMAGEIELPKPNERIPSLIYKPDDETVGN